MITTNDSRKYDADKLYEKYGKPLEKKHWGKFVAITPQRKTLMGADLLEVTVKALNKFGSGNFLFKVGEKVVGRIR